MIENNVKKVGVSILIDILREIEKKSRKYHSKGYS